MSNESRLPAEVVTVANENSRNLLSCLIDASNMLVESLYQLTAVDAQDHTHKINELRKNLHHIYNATSNSLYDYLELVNNITNSSHLLPERQLHDSHHQDANKDSCNCMGNDILFPCSPPTPRNNWIEELPEIPKAATSTSTPNARINSDDCYDSDTTKSEEMSQDIILTPSKPCRQRSKPIAEQHNQAKRFLSVDRTDADLSGVAIKPISNKRLFFHMEKQNELTSSLKDTKRTKTVTPATTSSATPSTTSAATTSSTDTTDTDINLSSDEEIAKLLFEEEHEKATEEARPYAQGIIYTIHKIKGFRMVKRKPMYLVSWAGYDSSYDSWEPAKNIFDKNAIEEYWMHCHKGLERPKCTYTTKF